MKNNIHFVGIGGSGMSAVAMLAHEQGYSVSGCDLQVDTIYLSKLNKTNIQIHKGHSKRHIEKADIVAVSPALFFQNKDHPEVIAAKKRGILMTWQEFMGKHLQKDKKTICISGTHGKSTTTALASIVFEKAGLDPSVMIGATVIDWNSNYRHGKSDIFITESDEFYDNFLNYKPDTIVLNNIEYEHPDYFKSRKQMFESYRKHIENIKGSKTLIFNQDSPGVIKLLTSLNRRQVNKLNLVGYSISSKTPSMSNNFINVIEISESKKTTKFTIRASMNNVDYKKGFSLPIPGQHNISNALGVIALGISNQISLDVVNDVISQFTGVGRRFELLGVKSGVSVYDDYAHHPTEIRATLKALRQRYPKDYITAIIEPHSFSRTKAFLKDYNGAFDLADKVIIVPVFKGRDKNNYGVTSESIATSSQHKNVKTAKSFRDVINMLKNRKKHLKGVVVIMGAGKSYQLARDVLKSL